MGSIDSQCCCVKCMMVGPGVGWLGGIEGVEVDRGRGGWWMEKRGVGWEVARNGEG